MAETASTARPTLADWMSAPGNRWAFRHVRELIPTARVRRGATVRALPHAAVARPAGARVRRRARHDAAHRRLARGEQRRRPRGPARRRDRAGVARARRRRRRDARRHERDEVRHRAARRRARRRGAARPRRADRPLRARGGGLGVRRRDRAPPARHDDRHGVRRGLHAERRRARLPPVDGLVPARGLAARPARLPADDPARRAPHGARFHYVSPNTDMLGWVLERAAGEPYADALSRYLWAPLGAEQDADVTVDPRGQPARRRRPLRHAARHGPASASWWSRTAPASCRPPSSRTCAAAATRRCGRPASGRTACPAARTAAAGTSPAPIPTWPSRSASTASCVYADPRRAASWSPSSRPGRSRATTRATLLAIDAARALAASPRLGPWRPTP